MNCLMFYFLNIVIFYVFEFCAILFYLCMMLVIDKQLIDLKLYSIYSCFIRVSSVQCFTGKTGGPISIKFGMPVYFSHLFEGFISTTQNFRVTVIRQKLNLQFL